jgi:hypothetical protein
MMSASYLRMQAGERLISLLLNRSPKDKRPIEALRIEAAKQVVKEARRAERLAAPSHERPTLSNAFEVLFARIWRTVQNTKQFDALMARKNSTPPKVEPTIADAPIVCDEPAQAGRSSLKDNIVQFPPNAPLVRANFSSAKLIDDAEFLSRYHDQTTSNWRASIQQNESVNKLRVERSAQLRHQQPKYVG